MSLTESQWEDFEAVVNSLRRAKSLIQGELKEVLSKIVEVKEEIIDDAARVAAIMPVANLYYDTPAEIVAGYTKLVALNQALVADGYYTF